MRTAFAVAAIVSAASAGYASDPPSDLPSLQEAWAGEDLSPEQRTALVERTVQAPFAEAAPLLLKAKSETQPLYGINYFPEGAPWNGDRLQPRDRRYIMVVEAWRRSMSIKEDDPAKAKVLLSLLRRASTAKEKQILIHAILNYEWSPDAAPVLREIAKDGREDLSVRSRAASTLLSRTDINAAMPLAIEVMQAHEKGRPRLEAFHSMSNQGNRLFTLTDENQRALLVFGFKNLAALPKEDLQSGYFAARRLGFVLRIENEFAPDQKAPRYQGDHGLTDEFFIDTTKNAQRWYSANQESLPLLPGIAQERVDLTP
ncbi:hypothetical protein [Alienimonas chondri]|uniref:HEAT repeat domain-containing protein n=1 Tax=Alienimonas chondri TaxID=2681879 RepID=A0ABX1VH14_9PLAN|nr:hypothetical protein [Alienimonas chondri]NNJ27418.1 hypothetical protein [Alienimonas chondri]